MIKDYLVLTPTENLVAKALDKHPDGLTVSAISTKIRLARTSVYSAVSSLSKKHLITRAGFTYSIRSQLCEKTLQIVSASAQIHTFMQELLGLKKGEIVYSIESDDEIRELFRNPKEMLYWQKAVAERGIVLKGIGTKNAVRILRALAGTETLKHISRRSGASRVTGEHIDAACTLVSFRDSVVFFSRKRNYFYRIDDAEVAKFVRSIIELLYNHLEYQKIA